MEIHLVTVVGAGTMGNGIAHTFAQHGYSVVLYDLTSTQLNKAREIIHQNLERQHYKGTINEAVKAACLGNIRFTTDKKKAFSQADLIIEAVSENLSTKKDVFQEINRFIKPHCILASNTSSLSITALGALTQDPSKVIGMHFMNPVPIMPLIEIVKGQRTDEIVVETLYKLSQKINKTPLVVSDSPGFVANRIAIPMINEAVETLMQGVSGVTEIDRIMKLGMGHPMGPLQLADFIGLDVCLAILEVLYAEFGKEKYAPCILLRRLVVAGQLGRKTDLGFYDYRTDPKNPSVAPQFS
tara:strand:+ start:5352 stop:6245 length:894 start_codon:yes stop_codon:yes gene_type:complete